MYVPENGTPTFPAILDISAKQPWPLASKWGKISLDKLTTEKTFYDQLRCRVLMYQFFLSYQRNVPTFPYNLNYLTRSKRSLSTWRSVCPQRARCDRPALWTMMSSWNPTNYKLVTNYINLPFWQAIELIWKFRLKICHLTITMNYYYEIIFRWNESSMMCFSQKFKNAVKLKSHFLARKLKFRIL